MTKNRWMLCLTLGCLLVADHLLTQSINQQAKLIANNAIENQNFGTGVEINGDYAIVGAPRFETEEGLENAGAVYVFKRKNRKWKQSQLLTASDVQAGDGFGESVTIQGNTLMIGSSGQDYDAVGENQLENSGAVYVFKLKGEIWRQEQKITASDRKSNDCFGGALELDGDYVAVGADGHSDGGAYVFNEKDNVWLEKQIFDPPDQEEDWGSFFGCSIALKGTTLMIGNSGQRKDPNGENILDYAGAVYVYELKDSLWRRTQTIVADDRRAYTEFGFSISLSEDYAIVGTFQEEPENIKEGEEYETGAAYILHKEAGHWICQQKLAGVYDKVKTCGVSVTISGDYAGVGLFTENKDQNGQNEIDNAGMVYVYRRKNNDWNLCRRIVASDRKRGAYFGYSLASEGSQIIVGADNVEAAYLFRIRSGFKK